MLFSSFQLLAVVLPLYFALPHRWQNRMLVAASYVFYAAWNWRSCSLLLLSTLVDLEVARAMARRSEPAARRHLLGLRLG